MSKALEFFKAHAKEMEGNISEFECYEAIYRSMKDPSDEDYEVITKLSCEIACEVNDGELTSNLDPDQNEFEEIFEHAELCMPAEFLAESIDSGKLTLDDLKDAPFENVIKAYLKRNPKFIG